jgi:exopolysaccharide production protein ExoQ
MATALYLNDKVRETSLWQQVSCWVALLPILFITASGRIETDSTPIAFRFTAMAEDSLSRRLVRLGCSVLIILLLSTRINGIISACRKSKLLLALNALAFISISWSQIPSHTLVDALNLLLTTLFAIYIYQRYPGERIVSLLNFAAFLSLLLCLLTVVVVPGVGIDGNQGDAWRGIFGQKNNCATACTLFLVVGLHTNVRGLIERVIRASVIVLSVIFIIMSASRTGWIVSVIAVALTYIVRLIVRFKFTDRVLALLLLLAPLTFAAVEISTNFNSILAMLDKDPTLTQRTIIWAQVLPSIAKHPFLGYGYSAFWAGLNGESMHAVLVTGWMEGQAQDGYLDVLLEVGLLGLVPLLVLFARALWQGVKLVERRDTNNAVLLAIVMIPLVLVENIGESSLLVPLGIPWFYVLISLAILGLSGDRAEAQ